MRSVRLTRLTLILGSNVSSLSVVLVGISVLRLVNKRNRGL